MGKSSQRKGSEGERELAALLRDYGFDTQAWKFDADVLKKTCEFTSATATT